MTQPLPKQAEINLISSILNSWENLSKIVQNNMEIKINLFFMSKTKSRTPKKNQLVMPKQIDNRTILKII